MYAKQFVLILLIVLLSISCGNSRSKSPGPEYELASSADGVPPPPPPPPEMTEEMKSVDLEKADDEKKKIADGGELGKEVLERKLVKKGNLTIKEKNIKHTVEVIKKLLKSYDGFLTRESMARNNYYSTCQLSINVNSKNFDRFLFALDSSKMNITEKTLSSEDITSRYIDNETRLNNKKKLEQRYLEILKTARNVSEILEIESKIEAVRADIESKEGIKKLFDHEVRYSEIEVQITDEVGGGISSSRGFWGSVADKLEDGWNGGKSFLLFLIAIWPMYIVGFLLYKSIRFFLKRRKGKTKASSL